MKAEWLTDRLPEIPEGTARHFLVAAMDWRETPYVVIALYLNKYQENLCGFDNLEIDNIGAVRAEPVHPEEEDDQDDDVRLYRWTGWFCDSSERNDTWCPMSDRVIGWMPAPEPPEDTDRDLK